MLGRSAAHVVGVQARSGPPPGETAYDPGLTPPRRSGDASRPNLAYGWRMDPAVQLARVPSRPPLSDLLIAGALSAWAVLEAFFVSGSGSVPVRILAGCAMTVPLAWRRRYALPVVLFVPTVLLIRGALGAENDDSASFFPAILLAAFSVALYERRLPLAVAGGAWALGCTLGAFVLGLGDDTGADADLGNFTIISFFVCAAWTAGLLLRRRAEHVRRVEAESGELAKEAVADERARIARELHDIVAHSVSIISVQSGAVEQYLERDPARAREHLETVQRVARDALTEMRRLTGVLREEPAGYEPQPGLGRVPELVDQARAAGLDVTLAEEGERRAVPPGVDLAAFRIVQEALTNARKHAGAVAAQVHVRYSESGVEVEIENAASENLPRNGDGAGHGLVGMRERVRVYGGTLDTGPQAGGGFRVRATLPLEAER
jgi:signal transduction histidine kinase